MDSTSLFTAALGLQDPWKVDEVRFEPEQGEIHFDLACDAKRLGCPVCAAGDQSIHDRTQRTWQHLHFFQFKAFLHAPLPRVKCAQCGKVTQVEVPWARPGSGFTLLMDALVLTLAKKLPVSAIAKMFGVSENRIWRAINVHVESARQATTYSEVRALGVDEKYVGRRLGYLSIFHDPLARRVIGTAEGRKADTYETFKADFESHKGVNSYPVASGRSESDRVGFAPTGKAPPLHGARRTRGLQCRIVDEIQKTTCLFGTVRC